MSLQLLTVAEGAPVAPPAPLSMGVPEEPLAGAHRRPSAIPENRHFLPSLANTTGNSTTDRGAAIASGEKAPTWRAQGVFGTSQAIYRQSYSFQFND